VSLSPFGTGVLALAFRGNPRQSCPAVLSNFGEIDFLITDDTADTKVAFQTSNPSRDADAKFKIGWTYAPGAMA
jgi:hypothetical protein